MLAFRPDGTGRQSISQNKPGDALSYRIVEASRPVPFLRVPPFPGAQRSTLVMPAAAKPVVSDDQIESALDLIRSNRVGGNYWGPQLALPDGPYRVVRVRNPIDRVSALERLPGAVASLDDDDPWHLLSGASDVVVDADDEVALIAAIVGVPVECVGSGTFEALSGKPTAVVLRDAFREHVASVSYRDPFSGEPISLAEAIECCAFWRRLIDSNRDIAAAVGFAFWKKATVAPLLWRGSDSEAFVSTLDGVRDGERIAAWRTRTPARLLSELERRDVQLIEVEDGFIRSVGLGADCVPPLSIVVDRLGAYFDPSRPSELEQLIQTGDLADDLLKRAKRLRGLIVASGLSKYSAGHQPLERRTPDRRHILVPGQVEDDRAVVSGGAGLTSNLELLRRVRADAPDAYLIYKPHPDVEAGHRKGVIADEECLSVADEIVRNEPITALIDLVDEIHVNTSLAGFEALLREKPVTTHGVPFYAGWGLTRDLGPVPPRRSARRALDELVAAALLLYPRYVDPVTGLPCPAEILVCRLAESANKPRDGILVALRRVQGRCRRTLAKVWGPG